MESADASVVAADIAALSGGSVTAEALLAGLERNEDGSLCSWDLSGHGLKAAMAPRCPLDSREILR